MSLSKIVQFCCVVTVIGIQKDLAPLADAASKYLRKVGKDLYEISPDGSAIIATGEDADEVPAESSLLELGDPKAKGGAGHRENLPFGARNPAYAIGVKSDVYICNNRKRYSKCYNSPHDRMKLCPGHYGVSTVLVSSLPEHPEGARKCDPNFSGFYINSEEDQNFDKTQCSIRTSFWTQDLPMDENVVPFGLVDVDDNTGMVQYYNDVPKSRQDIRYNVLLEPIDKYGKVVFKLRLVCRPSYSCVYDNHFIFIDDSGPTQGIALVTSSAADASVFVFGQYHNYPGTVSALDGLYKDADKARDCGAKVQVATDFHHEGDFFGVPKHVTKNTKDLNQDSLFEDDLRKYDMEILFIIVLVVLVLLVAYRMGGKNPREKPQSSTKKKSVPGGRGKGGAKGRYYDADGAPGVVATGVVATGEVATGEVATGAGEEAWNESWDQSWDDDTAGEWNDEYYDQ